MSERTRYTLWTIVFVLAFVAGATLVGGLNRRQVNEKIKQEERNENPIRNLAPRR
jgi:cytochrome c-type biogenesis protein CcmH/NrfF